MKKILTVLGIAAMGVLGLSAPLIAGNEKPPNEGVCTGTHLSPPNNETKTITYTAPEGFLVASYCVKAGSINQGNGPEYVTLDPPAASVTFSHSSGKDISHYSITLVPKGEDTTPTETEPTETTPTETTPTETTPTTPTETTPTVTETTTTETETDVTETTTVPPDTGTDTPTVPPKPDPAPVVKSVKPGKKPGTVIITTTDGKTHVGVQGSG